MARDSSFFGLNRPEYPPSRELFMSELAWSLTPKVSPRRVDPDFGPAGIAYRDLGAKKNDDYAMTCPRPGDERFETLASSLKERLRLESVEHGKTAARVLLGELEAPASARATRSAATPLTIEAALLQDRRGITGKNNPANIALILEKMYALGGGTSTVSGRWASALHGAGVAGLPSWVSDGIKHLLPATFQEAAAAIPGRVEEVELTDLRRPAWLVENKETPYHWFADAWDRLCTAAWIDSMPRRRWADWAACVARTAIATGFMFEMHLTRRMVIALASNKAPRDAVRLAIDDSARLFSWDDRLGRTAADVGPTMNQLAATGSECLSLLSRLTTPVDEDGWGIKTPGDYDQYRDGLAKWLADARAGLSSRGVNIPELVADVLDAQRRGSANNTWETMRYSLLDRSPSGAGDLYALLRSAGGYTWVEPGQEWLVTIASLQSEGPGKSCRLNDLDAALSSMGIDAAQQTLVARLEGFGLARSSHDADDALEIMAGF